jgi:hypothetical protein
MILIVGFGGEGDGRGEDGRGGGEDGLRCPPREAVRSLASDLVAATVIDGELAYGVGVV